MADYKNMTAIEALREAKDASGMTRRKHSAGSGHHRDAFAPLS